MPTPPGPLEPPQPPYQVVLVDRDDLPETFASSLRRWWSDGVNIVAGVDHGAGACKPWIPTITPGMTCLVEMS
jgi:hypothetical protein